MRQLPTGTVTFLFSDIEGSTRLLRELGDEYATVRSEHSEIIRVAIARHDGVEIGTEGDSFFVTFRTARDAVLAAIDAQRGLSEHRWHPGSPVRVRMGIHTGEGRLSGNDYVGMDVHRAARIAAAAHGGQVIISAATEALVEHQLPDGVRVRDLGEHRLKDIVNPERLYDLVIGGLAADFPPPRSLEARPNNLPLQLTSFVGREDQLTEIKQLLQNARLVTLTGAGGTGKTRLALQAAADTLSDYRDGTFFVDLSAVVDPALVPAAIAQAIGIAEIPGKPILEALKGDLRTKQILLVLDNFEQVVDAAAAVEELLTGCPDVKALITSRVVLTLRGEHEYPVPPLVPPDLNRLPEVEKLGQIEAVRLFAERAQAVEPRFRLTQENAVAVAELTVRLDALPLAIELAASRSKVLSPKQMLPLLAQSLSLLSSRSRSLPERQRTLRGAIGWSYDLLAEPEQRVFAQLAVFSGGWTLQAAQAVTNAGSALEVLEHLTSLADKSLVRVAHSNGDSRFSMLETIREFGWDRLQADGSLDETRRRHGTYFVEKALEAEPHLTGPAQATWLDYCDRERDNLRTALRWTIDTREAEIAQSAAAALWRYWQQRGHLNEGKRWLDEVLTMPGGDQPTRARAKALTGAGGIAWWRIDHPAARQFYGEALAIERHIGEAGPLAEALYNDAFALGAGGETERATEMLQESLDLFRAAGDEHGVARALTMLVIRDAMTENWEGAIPRLEESVAIWRGVGDRLQLAFDLVWLAFVYGRARRWRAATTAALEAVDIFREAGNPTGIALVFRDLSFICVWKGRAEDALRFAGAAESLRERIGGGPPQGFGGMLEGDPAAEARQQLSDEVAQRSWDEGLGMDVEQVVGLAREMLAG